MVKITIEHEGQMETLEGDYIVGTVATDNEDEKTTDSTAFVVGKTSMVMVAHGLAHAITSIFKQLGEDSKGDSEEIELMAYRDFLEIIEKRIREIVSNTSKSILEELEALKSDSGEVLS